LLSSAGLAFRDKFSPAIPQASLDRKKFPAHTGHLHRAVPDFALAANGSQTGEGINQRERAVGPRKTSKPRPRQLNG